MLAFFALPTEAHEFHISRCEIVYRTATSSFEITHHMFADDVELRMREDHEGPLHLATEIEVPQADSLFSEYIVQNIRIAYGDKTVPLSYLGKEAGEGDAAMWVYVEAALTPLPDDLTIGVDLLLDTFNDQKNIVSFQIDNGRKQMFLLDRTEPEVTFATR